MMMPEQKNEVTTVQSKSKSLIKPKIGPFYYCNDCGGYRRYEKNENCSCGGDGRDSWTHSRFRRGELVRTEFGDGVVVGIDLPRSQAWRWLVLINVPGKKRHSYIEQHKPMAFFDHEVSSACHKNVVFDQDGNQVGVYVE